MARRICSPSGTTLVPLGTVPDLRGRWGQSPICAQHRDSPQARTSAGGLGLTAGFGDQGGDPAEEHQDQQRVRKNGSGDAVGVSASPA
jgi:hypothetical protein